jgi:hypothetical protein
VINLAKPGADTIAFAFTGPGAGQLTVDAHGASHVMQINAGATVVLGSLPLAGGRDSSFGGNIVNNGFLLVLWGR